MKTNHLLGMNTVHGAVRHKTLDDLLHSCWVEMSVADNNLSRDYNTLTQKIT